MLVIMLMGLAVVVVYFISHYSVIALERRVGRPLGVWRTALFFVVFLGLMIVVTEVLPLLVGE